MHKLIYLLILIFSTLIFSFGLFSYPHYENDEGIYMSQAWAVLEQQTLAAYTFWYDHSPLGWFIIAGWLWMTGGISTFGFSVDSGRVLMLIIHIFSTLFVMMATHRLTEKRIPAYLAGLIFAASPIIIFFGRRVLLDNILVVFILASLVLLASRNRSLASTIISAFLAAIAILSKLTGVIFIPALLYIVWTRAESNRMLHLGLWLTIVMLLVSLFPIFAAVKGELFPAEEGAISLVGGVLFHLDRGDGFVWDAGSPIADAIVTWWELDPILLSMALISFLILLVLSIRTRLARAAALLMLFPLLFLFRGSFVFEFYILVLAPFIAIGYAVVLAHLYHWFRSRTLVSISVIITIVLVFIMAVPLAMSVRVDQSLYHSDQTSVQRQAVFDILEHGTADEVYIVNSYGITEFLAAGFDPLTDPYVEWDVKIENDPEVRERFERYARDRKVRFVISQFYEAEPYTDDFDFLLDRWRRTIRESTDASDGWEVAVFVEHTPEQMLERTYPTILRDHLDRGRVVVSYDEHATLARYQGLMMLIAVRASDAATFDEVWRATRVLEYPNGALNWRHPTPAGANQVATDPASSITIARALLEAHEKWGDDRYLRDAHRVLDGIWFEDIAYTTEGLPYLAKNNYADDGRSVTVVPAAFDPRAFAVFERRDAAHPWRTLTYTSWLVLEGCTRLGAGRLPPDECSVEILDGRISALGVDRSADLHFGFEASRSLVALADAALAGDERAEAYLKSLVALEEDWERRGTISARYSRNGLPISAAESVVYYAPVLASFAISDPYKAGEVFGTRVVPQYFETASGRAYWEDDTNVVTQLWTWLAIEAYARSLDEPGALKSY